MCKISVFHINFDKNVYFPECCNMCTYMSRFLNVYFMKKNCLRVVRSESLLRLLRAMHLKGLGTRGGKYGKFTVDNNQILKYEVEGI